jgi:amidase
VSDLSFMTATEALSRFRDKSLSPVELLDAMQAQVEQTEQTVNSLVDVDFERARVRAKEAEARYAGHGDAARPLEGLPVAIKEEEAIAGEPRTLGSLTLVDKVAGHTADLPQRILNAGAVVHARTKTPEFSAAAFTKSRLWGVTRNPWNPAVAAGGSSGGAGAALASGVTTLASGSDIGGSIRVPASFNGVVGYKPPFGRVPNDPEYNHDRYLHGGPMARTVRDAALFQNVLAGPSPRDIYSLRPKYVLPETFPDVRGMRIALSVDLGDYVVDPEIRANTLAVAAGLREAGAHVDEVDLHLSREKTNRAAAIHYVSHSWDELTEESQSDLISPYVTAAIKRFEEYAAGGMIPEGFALENELYAEVARVFESYDALITPTVATRGLDADADYAGHDVFEIEGQQFTDPLYGLMTMPWNVMSQCPALSVPSGFAGNGVPTGVQIVGPTYDDAVVFRLGVAIEEIVPMYGDASRRPSIATS